jgi:molybdenum cofactor cytidylyltransferase
VIDRPGVGVILLAAGASARLGTPKQLLPWEGEPLVRRAARVACGSRATPVIVVVGAYAPEVRQTLEGMPVEIIEHPEWPEGQGSSLRAGLAYLRGCEPPIDAAIVMLCDQPLVTAELLDALIDQHRDTGARIVASEYASSGPGSSLVRGVPALFHRSVFHDLDALRGDVGARGIIARYVSQITIVPFPGGALDVDLPDGT